ncbi:MAG: NAD(P)-binding domain-containing protein, partial [Bacilli bacterium]|nr:NAD(P)-binding domain-containing protein [Bacilli bacterium]
MDIYDSVIIGAGPAGMTAALYLLRAGKTVCLLERLTIGGQIAESPRLENYPSIVSISGLEFSNNLYDQIDKLGVNFDFGDVEKIEKTDKGFAVFTNYGEYLGKTVIIAAGCEHRKLGLPREQELTGHGISYCATCDGAFFNGEDVLVIGDANTAVQYAIALAETSRHVQVVTLFDKWFADNVIVERMKALTNLDYVHNFNAIRFEGGDELTGVTFENTQTKE